MTCAHVVAPPVISNPVGEVMDSPAVMTPAQAGKNSFGKVFGWSPFDLSDFNTVDAALIKPDLGTTPSNEVLGLGAKPSFVGDMDGFLKQGVDTSVEIWASRGNGHPISGAIDGIFDQDDNLRFQFGGSKFSVYAFASVLGYQASVVEGDSGSAVVHAQTRKVLGIHFGGIGGLGFCSLFENILVAFPGIIIPP
jgi:hypothetical protein